MSDGRAVLLIIGLMTTLPMNAEQQVFDSGAGILRDRTVIACFAHLVSGALYGFGTFEKAAFLVLRADHSPRCIDWPSTREFKQARWSGPMPAGVVAVAHTHPLSSPDASPDDIKLARRIGMPIFVLTPDIVSVIHADGRVVTLVYHKPWISGEAALTPPVPEKKWKGEAK